MFSFDGKHASEYFDKVLLAKRDMTAPSSPILQELRDKPGAYFFGVQTGIYEMEFEVFIQGTDRQDLWKRIRKANAWLKQEELKKLEFDDEPGLYYKAICVESLELDEILEYGFGTIKFIAPDPYAFGIHQKQRVNSPDVMFSRVGMRYREDGTQVTENYPVYKAGKFGQAALVEEGTTNLLTTASAPAQEEVSVEIGADYYLSTIGGSAIVEHKKVETLTKTNLDKEGIDFEQSFENWSNGTFENTEEVNGFLRLSRTGETIHQIWDTKEEWEAEGNILDGVVGDESGRLTQILPEFTVKDDMSDAIGTRWNLYGTDASNFVTQQDGFVRFDLRDAAPSGEIGIGYYHDYLLKQQQLFNFSQATILFTARTTNSGMSFWITNANKGYQFTLPNTQGKTTPFIIRIFSETEVEYYAAGQQAPSEWYSIHDDTGSPRLQFYVNQDDFGLFEIDSFCFISQIVDLPPINNTWWTGTWESEFIDLSSVGTLENLTVRFQNEFLGTDGLTITEFHYQLRIDGIEQEWQVLHEDYEIGSFSFQIPELAKGTDLTGKEIRFKFVVYTAEPWSTDIKFLELQAISTYHTFGTWESSILDISQVGKAASTEISWVNESVPAETSVKVETQLSFDGGSTWEDYEEATNGKGIPGINQQTDLSNALLRYKAVLTTNDDTETPSIDSASIKLKTGYKASETIELSGVDVNGIGVAENSTIDLPENNGESVTSVTFEYSIDDGNTWTPMQDGQPFIQDIDLTGKTLRIRYTLATSDTNYTPNIGNSLTWLIQQQEGNKIKPVTTTISLTPVNASRWQLEKKHFATGWHIGTREPEALKVWVNHLIETWENEGAISFWFYDDGIKKQQSPIILDTSGEVYRIKVFKDENNGVYVLEIGEIEVLAAPVVTGWNHLVLTWDETNGYFYLNDSQVGTFDKEAYPLYFEDKSYLWLGSSRDKTDHLNGLIDDIALFNRKLEENEINELFQQPAQRDPNANVYHLDGNLTSDDDTSLTYEGTAKTFPKFTITFARDSSYFRVANGRDFVLVNYDFKAGDVLEIDNEMELVLLNTGPLMKAVSLDSDFFEIKHDDEIIVDPTGFANVDIEFVERWV